MYNRLRSSVRKNSELQAKHIKKFKFRGCESNGGVLFSEGCRSDNVNNCVEISNLSIENHRKRKMAYRGGYSMKSKVRNLFIYIIYKV